MVEKIDIRKKFKCFSDHWSPKVIAEMNDYHFKIARVKGEFVWHNHEETDEAFIIIEGRMKIMLKDKTIDLCEGDLFVVPRGIDHKPIADEECKIMLVEPKGVVNTGKIKNELTAENDIWI